MAQTIKNKSQSPLRWTDALPSRYETLIVGFHAGMTVGEMLKHLQMDDKVKAPKKIQNIKVGSFTPHMFKDEEFKDFWENPVPSYDLCEHKEIFNALNDPDVIEVMKKTKYTPNICHPTLETLARMTHAQYIGFQVRMAEMTSKNMHARVEGLRNPMNYKALRESPFVKKNKLQNVLPKTAPYFEVMKKEFSVKSIESAMSKAYTRTGKPKNKEAFLKNPNKYGVFAVKDLQRTSIKLDKSGDLSPQIIEERYMNVRNIVIAGLAAGELGIVLNKNGHSEVTCSALYPPSSKAVDQIPGAMINGNIYHSGPLGCFLSAPVEIQIPLLPGYIHSETHKIYETQRALEAEKGRLPDDSPQHEEYAILIKNYEVERITMFESNLPPSFVNTRHAYLKDGKISKTDHMMNALNKYDMFDNANATRARAIAVAYEEFPDTDLVNRQKTMEFDPFSNNHSPIMEQALHDIIESSIDRKPKAAPKAAPKGLSVAYRA